MMTKWTWMFERDILRHEEAMFSVHRTQVRTHTNAFAKEIEDCLKS